MSFTDAIAAVLGSIFILVAVFICFVAYCDFLLNLTVGFGAKRQRGRLSIAKVSQLNVRLTKINLGGALPMQKNEDERITPLLVESVIRASCKELNDTETTNRSKIEILSIQKLQTSLDEDYRKKDVSIIDVVIEKSGFDKESPVCLVVKSDL